MKLSIIIPVKDDVSIKECLVSIIYGATSIDKTENTDYPEVVICYNTPSDEVKEIVSNAQSSLPFEIRTVEIEQNNLAKAYNSSIEASSYERVLIMDSDCIFSTHSINMMYEASMDHVLVKGRPLIDHDNFKSMLTALSRQYHAGDLANAYSPPLIINKNIKNKIGGYFFHEEMVFTEDHEFNQRVEAAGLNVYYLPDANITHEKLSVLRDLKSAFRYGAGQEIGVAEVGTTEPDLRYGGFKLGDNKWINIMGSLAFDAVRLVLLPVLFLDVMIKKNFAVACYMAGPWYAVHTAGYYGQAMLNLYVDQK